MSTYSEKLRDPRWQKKRLEVMNRDNFTCRDCSATEKTLQVHHCHYERGEPWNTATSLLLTLCDECHDRRQEIEDRVRRAIGVLLARTAPGEVELMAQSFEFYEGNPDERPVIIREVCYLEQTQAKGER